MDRTQHTIDATNLIAGRLASRIALLLQGKNKPSYQAYIDCGDIVLVQNVSAMRFSGKKLEKKVYHRHTGYPSGVRTTRLSDLFQHKPDVLLRNMVMSMLPRNKLRARMIKRLQFVRTKKG